MLHIRLSFGAAVSTFCGNHLATDWQVATDNGFTNIVADSLMDSVHKEYIDIDIPSNLVGTTLYCRARGIGSDYQDKPECVGNWGYSSAIVYQDQAEANIFPVPDISFDLGYHLNGNGTYSTGWFIVLNNADEFFNLTSYTPYVLLLKFDTLDGSQGYFFPVSFFDNGGNPFAEVAYYLNQTVYEGKDLVVRASVQLHAVTGPDVFSKEVTLLMNAKPNVKLYSISDIQPGGTNENYTPIAGLNQGYVYSRINSKYTLKNTADPIYYKLATAPAAPYTNLPALSSGQQIFNVTPLVIQRNQDTTGKNISVLAGVYDTGTSAFLLRGYYWIDSSSVWGSHNIPSELSGQKFIDARVIDPNYLVVVMDDVAAPPLPEVEKTFNIYFDNGSNISHLHLLATVPVLSPVSGTIYPTDTVGFPTGTKRLTTWGGKLGKVYVGGMNTLITNSLVQPHPSNPIFEIDVNTGDMIRLTDLPVNLNNFSGIKLDNDSFYIVGINVLTGNTEGYIYTISKDMWEYIPVLVGGNAIGGRGIEITKTLDNKVITAGGTIIPGGGSYNYFLKTGL